MPSLTDEIADRYPHIAFRRQWEMPPELAVLLGRAQGLVEAIGAIPLFPEVRLRLHGVSLRKGARATAAIEGNTLSEEEVARVAAGAALPDYKGYEAREMENIIRALNQVFDALVAGSPPELISPDLLRRFHDAIGRGLGEGFGAVPGQFAQSQRSVGPYRAPRPEDVPALVDRMCEWLRHEFRFPNQSFTQAIVQAIVTHVYIEWIHPFDDGNGRTGRMVEFYILARAKLPSVASHLLANHYNDTRAEYYRQLDQAGKSSNLTAFLLYAIRGLANGLGSTLNVVLESVFAQMWRSLVYGRFEGGRGGRVAFRRQRAIALALPLDRAVTLDEIPTLSAEVAGMYSGVNPRAIARDVGVLEKLELVVRTPGFVRANRGLLDRMVAQRRDVRGLANRAVAVEADRPHA